MTRAFLAAGAQCTLVSLWPVPVAASKVFVHAFYTALLNGTKASAALADAMKTVQSSKQYSHPSNWAGERCFGIGVMKIDDPDAELCLLALFSCLGYMLIGTDVKLNSPSSLIGQALAEILQYPDRARDALRVLLHLVRHGPSYTMTSLLHKISQPETLMLHFTRTCRWRSLFRGSRMASVTPCIHLSKVWRTRWGASPAGRPC